MSTAPTPAAREYAAALARDPARRRALVRLRRLMPTPDGRLTRLYAAARLVTRLRPAHTYRTRWADTLAGRAGIDRSFVYQLARFADGYTADQVEQLRGAGVTWSHLAAALKLDDTALAVGLLLAAAGREWSVRRVQQYLGGVPADHPGPLVLPAAPAAAPDALVRSLYRHARPLVDRVLPALRAGGGMRLDQDSRELLAALAAGLQGLGCAPVVSRPGGHGLPPAIGAST